jgi:RIO kinase 2
LERGLISGLGRKIGVGKESDVFLAQTPEGTEVVCKFARLGRTSFR